MDIDVPLAPQRLDAGSTLAEWLADPQGSLALRKVISQSGAPVLDDEEFVRMIGNFPIGRLTAFPGFGITKESLDRLDI